MTCCSLNCYHRLQSAAQQCRYVSRKLRHTCMCGLCTLQQTKLLHMACLSRFSMRCLTSQSLHDNRLQHPEHIGKSMHHFNRLCICQCRSFAGEALERERFGADVVASYHSGVGFAKAKANVESLNRYKISLHLMCQRQLTALWLRARVC